MGLFSRPPQTMQELLERNKQFRAFIKEVLYNVWFRGNLSNGALDDQINMMWAYYERGEAPSMAAHQLLQIVNDYKEDNTSGSNN